MMGMRAKEQAPGKDSRALILQVALALFTQNGYEGTSIDDIRKAAGFRSKASLYTHFKSKEEVANALLDSILSQEEEVVIKAYEAAEPEPLYRFLAMGRAFIEWGLTHKQEYAFCFLRVQQELLMRGQQESEQLQHSPGILLGLLAQMRSHYPVRAIADTALLSMMIGLISRAVIDQNSFGQIALREKVDQIIEMCMGVLFTEQVPVP